MKTIVSPRQSPSGFARTAILAVWLGFAGLSTRAADPVEVQSGSVEGKFDGDKAHFVIQANLSGLGDARERSIYGATFEQVVRVARDRLAYTVRVKVDAVQGGLRDIVLALGGDGEVRGVTGEGLDDWSVRQAAAGRFLVLRLKPGEKPVTTFAAQITAETLVKSLPSTVTALTLTTEPATLANGFIRIEAEPGLGVQLANPTGIVPVDVKFLPKVLQPADAKAASDWLAFRFHGTPYSLPLAISVADPEARQVVLGNFRLVGRLTGDHAAFTLTAVARVKNPQGGSLDLLQGGVALLGIQPVAGGRLRFENGRFVAEFDKAGEFPIELQFEAAVRPTNGWNEVTFAVAPSALGPVVLQGLQVDTQFRFAGGGRPERDGEDFNSFLPADGRVKLAWKEGRPEAEGKLFFAAEALSQVAVSPGLLRQVALFDFRVMQGDLSRVSLLMKGEAEVTRVQGPAVLSWAVEPAPDGARRLVIQLNAAQKEQFHLAVQMQRPLGVFPQSAEVAQLTPEGATRFGGYVRLVNEGAVRLEVLSASGLSQISPEQIPQTDATRALLPAQTSQAFAYRFSGADYQLRLQADNILPELAVSEVLTYHLGENELAIEAELELDIREAPLRELQLQVPRGFTVARLNAAGSSDYFTTDSTEPPATLVRIVYAQPVAGRQVVQLRLERNQPSGEARWTLPRIEVTKAKSVRGYLGVTADAGFRVTPATTQGLTEIATAVFPKKLGGIQAAFRISEPTWQAVMNVERLPQTIQADVFNLFSVREGIAYGSTVLNYVVSGAPISALSIELSDEYFNVEFTGKYVRNWQKTTNGFQVQLHTPVSGSYTLLVTYERPFKPKGETLKFNGARPLAVQAEQGYTVVISAYQFKVKPAKISPLLTVLEPGEVPAEYRLLFDAPILAAYRYASRPFNLELELTPMTQGEMVSQVVDRAALVTRISEEGQVVTDARYFVKNKGTPNLRLILPKGTELWSVTVNENSVVPVQDQNASLIPMPQHLDPNTVNEVQLKVASKAKKAHRLDITAPAVSAPVLLAEWVLKPEAGRRLVYAGGTLTPVGGVPDLSGFAGLVRLFTGGSQAKATTLALGAVSLLVIAGLVVAMARPQKMSRFDRRHLLSGLVGAVACFLAGLMLVQLYDLVTAASVAAPDEIRLVAPVQQPDSVLNVSVGNVAAGTSAWSYVKALWPAILAVALWLYGLASLRAWLRPFTTTLAWVLLFWSALRLPQGGGVLFLLGLAFVTLQVLLPGLRQWWRVPRRPTSSTPAAAAGVALLLLGWHVILPGSARADALVTINPTGSGTAESIIQTVSVQDDFVFGLAKFRWQALKGDVLWVLSEPGVLTRLNAPADQLRPAQVADGDRRRQVLVAEKSGLLEAEVEYQTRVTEQGGMCGFVLPTPRGLVNRLNLTVTGRDVDVVASDAVSVRRDDNASASNTVVTVILGPVNDAWIGWKPRSRDPRREKTVFYAELFQVYVPGAGVIEGLHEAQIRPAQGELAELAFDIPAGFTITDVATPALSVWRFDPDTHRLRVGLAPAQAKPFAVLIKSQLPTGPLPVESTVGLVRVEGAAEQVGLVGVATGGEVQLDDVTAGALSAINLEDFPSTTLEPLRTQVAGLAVRRAFRYATPGGQVRLKAAAVEPDVRVESQQTLSLSEDRTLLAATLDVEITRSGIFKLTFMLPPGLDVESISGAVLSHWTELKTDAGRVVTLHLKAKTEGRQQFTVSLTGAGLRAAQGWVVPRLVLQEAAKQRGQLMIVPEQGLRLQALVREGVTQLDPLKVGVRQKGVLAFRLLQNDWRLTLDVEQVDAWIQVTSLQHVTVAESHLKVLANLQYEIENTGVKSLRVRLPAAAENLRFRGDQVADFVASGESSAADAKTWDVKLHRRMIGRYLLQVSYTVPLAAAATEASVFGVQAIDVNLQRGFLTLQSSGRLQARIESPPAALQPTEWQVIPRALQQDIQATAANYTFRLVDPDVRLPVRLDRHDAARLLPARVNSVTLVSVISDDGVMLTQVRVQIVPGDKRLLNVRLPKEARFWFAFVNQNSVWPWNDADEVLIPLEQHSKTGQASTVEFFFTSRTGSPDRRSLDLQLLGPKFDLPLENIRWQVYLSDKWRLTDWSGTLQLQPVAPAPAAPAVDLDTYLRNEVVIRQEQTKEAEQFFNTANRLLEQGDPQQARRAFQAAYGLSQNDTAFNEDARVQLQNLKMQQAIVGLNVRQAKVAGETTAQGAAPTALREGNYTQQEAKQLIERNTAEDNAVQLRLAERLIQQQDAAVMNPAAIRATIPEQGRVLTFTRPLEVNPWADLKISLEAKAVRSAPPGLRLLVLVSLLVLVAVLTWLLRGRSQTV